MTDCLILGFSDYDFGEYVKTVRMMGENSGAFKDLSLSFVEIDNHPYTSMDILNYFRRATDPNADLWHNADFLWPTITYLGSFLHQHGLTFDYVNLPHLNWELLKEKLLNDDILSVAITTTLYVMPQPILQLVSFIRKYNKSVNIIIGGPFIQNQTTPSLYDDRTRQLLFKSLGADFYVISHEGEQALVNILNCIKTCGDFATIPNIAYRRGRDYVTTPSVTERNSLEEYMVNYSLFSNTEYGEFLSLRTAKSCPFSCAFCGFPKRAGKYAYLDVEFVERELNAIREIGGVSTLTFIDDTFNVPKKRFKELLNMMIRNDYGFKWNSFYRSDHGDPEIIELMAAAGCEGVFLGCESGSDTILEKMNKTARTKHYLEAIPEFRKVGIVTYASFIIGFPGETDETVNETIQFIDTAKPDFLRAQLWYCDPLTPIWDKRDQLGIQGAGFNWSHMTMDSRQACEHIDRIFNRDMESTWLPQNGFEPWSIYYLMRKGISLDRIKLFLRGFNKVIRHRINTGIYSEDYLNDLQMASMNAIREISTIR